MGNNQTTLENNNKKKEVLIIGAGTGGCIVASQLLRKKGDQLSVTMVDPSSKHFYQPGWTLVGAGIKPFDWSVRDMSSVIPTKANWVKDAATTIDPDEKKVILEKSGKEIKYDYLVVAAGLELDWNFATGVAENIFKKNSPVVSNYTGGENTAAAIQRFPDGGTALFQVSPGVVKCGGAPLKATFLSWDYWKKVGKDLSRIDVQFMCATPVVFGVPHYLKPIEGLFKERQIKTNTEHQLREVKVPAPAGTPKPTNGAPAFEGVALIEDMKSKTVIEKPFHMLHLVPPMRAPKVVRESKLANAGGFVDVDAKTLQSNKYPDVFSVGDCSGAPTSKTAAAAIAQAPVLVHNLLQHNEQKKTLTAEYNGYTSCPLVVSKYPPQMLLAEFDYDKKPAETFPWDQRVCTGLRGRLNYFIKETVFPAAYWNFALSGRWFGSNTFFEPKFQQ